MITIIKAVLHLNVYNKLNDPQYKKQKLKEAQLKLSNEGYKLLSSTWRGFRAYYKVKCPNGHEYQVQWSEFHRGRRCRTCHNERMKQDNPAYKNKSRNQHREEMDQKFKRSLEQEGYTYDNRYKYKNNKSMIPVTCPNKHKFETNWNTWSSGKRCRRCFEDRVKKSRSEIQAELAAEGCELVGEYYGSEKPFKYICSCGNKSTIRIGDFRRGVRCSRCGGEKAKLTKRQKRVELLNKWEEENIGDDN